MLRMLKFGLAIIFIITVCISCSSPGYYSQSISGHLSLMSKREPIDDIVNDSTRDEKLIEQLIVAKEIRAFASSTLLLPDNDSYLNYVQLVSPYVMWNVFAAPEFSITLQKWCFPVAGCVQYRGYFDEKDAIKYADKLSRRGLDVYVAGVPAYSTLGWFDDPLLSTMLDRGEIIIASYIFHELAHQQFYVKGDSKFNEAFATAVAELGVRHWLIKHQRLDELEKYESWLKAKSVFSTLIQASRKEFEQLYKQSLVEDEMRGIKETYKLTLRKKFENLSEEYPQIKRYSKWISGPLNNAQLGAISIYRDLVPAFKQAYRQCGEDFLLFYRRVDMLAKLPKDERKANLIKGNDC